MPRSLVVPLAGLAAAGCIAVVPYAPRTTLIADQGLQDVKRLLFEVSTRALNPHITVVDANEEFFCYGWTETFLGPFYTPVTASHKNTIFYVNVSRIEIYENNNVFIWGPGDQRVDKILFGSLEDAKLFADCLTSLKATRLR